MKASTLFAPLFALLAAACAPAVEAQSPAETPVSGEAAPALWRLADDDTTIYLFGTIHILPDGYRWRNAAIDRALGDADLLVLETVFENGESESAQLMMQLGVTPGLPPLSARVVPEQWPELAAMIARGPFPKEFLDQLESWAAALMLVGVTLNDLDLAEADGVEDQLEAMFRESGRPVAGLETPAEQIGFFDGLPEEAQRAFLATVIDSPGNVREEFDAMIGSWSRGDEAGIAAAFDDELEVTPALRDALLTGRNRRWAAWIARRMDEPGTVFLAVGAGHLAGGESVQHFLAERGLEAVRVQ